MDLDLVQFANEKKKYLLNFSHLFKKLSKYFQAFNLLRNFKLNKFYIHGITITHIKYDHQNIVALFLQPQKGSDVSPFFQPCEGHQNINEAF